MLPPRKLLQILYQKALDSVHGQTVVRGYLNQHALPASKIALLAIGKAAPAMARGACDALADRIIAGLVISKAGHFDNYAFPDDIKCLEAGHPYPNQNSLDVGQSAINFLQSMPEDALMLVLISGGASALVEVLPPEITLDELERMNHWVIANGLDIEQINAIRKSVSCIKGGRLLSYFKQHTVLSLMMSDVPGDDPAVIGSGLLSQTSLSPAVNNSLPPWLQQMQQHAQQQTPVSSEQAVEPVIELIASNRTACEAAVQAARELGYEAYLHQAPLSDDAAMTGKQIARELLHAPQGVHIWGGETTVVLPVQPGRGGRNQHLALAAAQALQGHEGIWLLAIGTDGTDGPTEDAGALVDAHTIDRGEREGLDMAVCLEAADAGSYLEATGDLINTGPTGTNVMDLVIALKQ